MTIENFFTLMLQLEKMQDEETKLITFLSGSIFGEMLKKMTLKK